MQRKSANSHKDPEIRLLVGYAWSQKKQARFSMQGFWEFARYQPREGSEHQMFSQRDRSMVDRKHGVLGIDLLSSSLSEMALPLNVPAVLVHKLTDWMHQDRDGEDGIVERVQQWALQQQAQILDPIPIVRRLIHRQSMLELLKLASERQRLRNSGYPRCAVECPNVVGCTWQDIPKLGSSPRMGNQLCAPTLLACISTWIVVVKHAEACSSAESHQMVLLDTSILAKHPPTVASFSAHTPVLCQEFIPHSGRLYKVYGCGTQLHIQCRPSLQGSEGVGMEGFWAFDSQTLPRQFDGSKMVPLLTCAQEQAIREYVECIQQECKQSLTLFGLDVVVSEASDQTLYALDLNYFPSFEGIAEFQTWFLHLLLDSGK